MRRLIFLVFFSASQIQAQEPRALKESDFLQFPEKQVELGHLLFFDKILSGNKNIACATCHHPTKGTSDRLSLPVGEGGQGLGEARTPGHGRDKIKARVPRNAPALYNLGTQIAKVMFHDGRLEPDATQPSGFRNPAGTRLPDGLKNALSVQAMFPVTSADEMAGHPGENPIADLAEKDDLPGIWQALASRIRQIPGYVTLFKEVYGISASEITFVHIANALGAYEAVAFRADKSAFDDYLRSGQPLSAAANRGKNLFFGGADCSRCHSGPLLSDFRFHSIGMPQVGPGKGDGYKGRDDFGRERVTGHVYDRYKFRTPPLHNVARTGPWGHNGAYPTLEAVIRQHTHPRASLQSYDPSKALAVPARRDLDLVDRELWENAPSIEERLATIDTQAQALTTEQIGDLVSFLFSLSSARTSRLTQPPRRVPSGLPVED